MPYHSPTRSSWFDANNQRYPLRKDGRLLAGGARRRSEAGVARWLADSFVVVIVVVVVTVLSTLADLCHKEGRQREMR